MKNNNKIIGKALSNAGIEFEVDIATNIVMVKDNTGSVGGYAFHVDDTLMYCGGIWKDRPSKKALPKVLDLINRINHAEHFGSFSVNPEKGDILLLIYGLHPGRKMNEETVIECLEQAKHLNVKYQNALQSVMSGDETPAKAMEKAREGSLSHLSLIELVDDLVNN